MSLLSLIDDAIGLDAITKEMAESVEVAEGVRKRAEEARQFWVDYWESYEHPFSRSHTLRSGYVENPGDYAESIKVKFMKSAEGLPMARVTAHDYKARWIEYGSTHMPEFAPRAATVDHFGGTGKAIRS
ncbi:hypothetical protein TUM20983_27860 [Mycobacterium antarcticum]|uniref:hypothetical protein n=1 Tax=unclassified Mycolicibacterium TaxID=2636767 RepID=UPI0023A787CC|nr:MULTISPECIES: hypothetical protein [unclassified Mycolicibacterium]GLP75676.1 hypothetical protein TUM20983_27860 [Mycolicibacterium sp. TUM20983]GLP83977.1 hypothetical protein TUM20984_53970 [Mycolicibacterium sp. TUM20984]